MSNPFHYDGGDDSGIFRDTDGILKRWDNNIQDFVAVPEPACIKLVLTRKAQVPPDDASEWMAGYRVATADILEALRRAQRSGDKD